MQTVANEPPALSDEDASHLRLLSIFHYILGGLTALFSLFPLLHLAMGIAMVNGMLSDGNGSNGADQVIAGWLFIVFAGGFILVGLSLTGLIAYARRCLQQRRRHLLCMVTAGLSCLIMPFGTVLRAFSLIVLLRPTVKAAVQA